MSAPPDFDRRGIESIGLRLKPIREPFRRARRKPRKGFVNSQKRFHGRRSALDAHDADGLSPDNRYGYRAERLRVRSLRRENVSRHALHTYGLEYRQTDWSLPPPKRAHPHVQHGSCEGAHRANSQRALHVRPRCVRSRVHANVNDDHAFCDRSFSQTPFDQQSYHYNLDFDRFSKFLTSRERILDFAERLWSAHCLNASLVGAALLQVCT